MHKQIERKKLATSVANGCKVRGVVIAKRSPISTSAREHVLNHAYALIADMDETQKDTLLACYIADQAVSIVRSTRRVK